MIWLLPISISTRRCASFVFFRRLRAIRTLDEVHLRDDLSLLRSRSSWRSCCSLTNVPCSEGIVGMGCSRNGRDRGLAAAPADVHWKCPGRSIAVSSSSVDHGDSLDLDEPLRQRERRNTDKGARRWRRIREEGCSRFANDCSVLGLVVHDIGGDLDDVGVACTRGGEGRAPILRIACAVCAATSPGPTSTPCSSMDTCPAVWIVRVPAATTTCENPGLCRSPCGRGCPSVLISSLRWPLSWRSSVQCSMCS